MPTNIAKFNAELDKTRDSIHGDFREFYRQVALEVLTRIVFRTPTDTGRARGNWQVEFNMPASASLTVVGTEQAMTDFAISRGELKLGNIPSFSVVHITNNVEYISYLEYDRRSQQHPEGMIEITLTEMERWLSSINKKHYK